MHWLVGNCKWKWEAWESDSPFVSKRIIWQRLWSEMSHRNTPPPFLTPYWNGDVSAFGAPTITLLKKKKNETWDNWTIILNCKCGRLENFISLSEDNKNNFLEHPHLALNCFIIFPLNEVSHSMCNFRLYFITHLNCDGDNWTDARVL